jgi:putative membrane protein
MNAPVSRSRLMSIGWITVYAGVLTWSATQPKDYFIWWLEVFPALIALAVLVLTYRRFRLTGLAYTLILLHCIVLMVGGHYTYAEVPLFNWLKQAFSLARNDYDKIGHFAQGFVPAIVAREILVRKAVVVRRGWLGFIVVSIGLAISAVYELFEWFVAVLSGTAADAFLSMQGDVWDTQSDMAFALVGAILAMLALSRMQDRQIEALGADAARGAN